MLDKLTSGDFAPYLNQTFRIYFSPTESLEAELIQVKDLPGGYEDPDENDLPRRRQAFSLIFRSAQVDSYLPQKIYTVQHDQLGALDIFLVPIGPDQKGVRYQAIFN